MRAVLAISSLLVAGPVSGQVPPGFELIQVTDVAVRSRPDINNNSVVMWATRLSSTQAVVEVFKGGIVKTHFDDSMFNANPAINDAGDFVVLKGSTASGPFAVVLYRADGTVRHFDSDAVNSLDLNNAGQLVWVQDFSGNGTQTEVIRSDGRNTLQVSAHGLQSQQPKINSSGDVVFYARDLGSSTCFVQLFNGRATATLTDPAGFANTPDISDGNHIVWVVPGRVPGRDANQIICWDGEQEVVIAEDVSIGIPRINNNGDVGYAMANDQTGQADLLVRFADRTTYLLPGLGASVNGIDINNLAEVAVAGTSSGQTAIFMLRRIGPDGDFDHNCHRDVYDMAIFENCWTGADAGPPGGLLAGCNRADFDKDGDVDHDDFVAFNGVVTGPTNAVMGCVP